MDIRRGGRGRRGSPLGNPFVLTDAADAERRRIVCQAYDDLLFMTMMRPMIAWTRDSLRDFARRRGHVGPVTWWDGRAAVREIDRLVDLSYRWDIMLMCCCHPLECHGESVAQQIRCERGWEDTRPPVWDDAEFYSRGPPEGEWE